MKKKFLHKILLPKNRKNIILIEDNCESLGAKYNNKYLGTFGDFGTFSFFYSHQITSGEGGMIVCNDKTDYEILKSLRSHGWGRDLEKSFADNLQEKFKIMFQIYIMLGIYLGASNLYIVTLNFESYPSTSTVLPSYNSLHPY